MQIVATISEMQALAESLRTKGQRIGFVPTMGFLHEGHLSLMREARKQSDIVVVSIFVNPTQFGPAEDFERYPRDPEEDTIKCKAEGVDIIFMPSSEDLYHPGQEVNVNVEGISEILEGAIRPGHFRGVATIVAKLFAIVKPHRAFFGQKDFQQTVIIRQMVRGLNLDVEVIVLPTVREPDGLAMSSRNTYLNEQERHAAVSLYRALSAGEGLIRAGEHDPSTIKKAMRAVLEQEKILKIDYIEIADPDSLVSLSRVDRKAVLLVAARLGPIRVIDNIFVL